MHEFLPKPVNSDVTDKAAQDLDSFFFPHKMELSKVLKLLLYRMHSSAEPGELLYGLFRHLEHERGNIATLPHICFLGHL